MEPFRALGLFLCLPKMPASGVVPNRERCHVGASDTKLLLLFRKKSRLLRLLGCKRPRNASAALPTFCEYTPCHRHPNWAGLPSGKGLEPIRAPGFFLCLKQMPASGVVPNWAGLPAGPVIYYDRPIFCSHSCRFGCDSARRIQSDSIKWHNKSFSRADAGLPPDFSGRRPRLFAFYTHFCSLPADKRAIESGRRDSLGRILNASA